jgi:hypothetical protein
MNLLNLGLAFFLTQFRIGLIIVFSFYTSLQSHTRELQDVLVDFRLVEKGCDQKLVGARFKMSLDFWYFGAGLIEHDNT